MLTSPTRAVRQEIYPLKASTAKNNRLFDIQISPLSSKTLYCFLLYLETYKV